MPNKQPPKNNPVQPGKDHAKTDMARQIGNIVLEQTRTEAVSRITAVMKSESFSGPIPHPEHFARYEQVMPGAAERIMVMAENHQEHRIKTERRVIGANILYRNMGLILGAVLFLVLIGCALYTAIHTSSAVIPMVFLSTGVIGGGIGMFINGRQKSR